MYVLQVGVLVCKLSAKEMELKEINTLTSIIMVVL